jgi:hypothetical protein
MPGQSYISEAAASVLDRELGTNIVPRTEVVALSSPAFYYDWIDLERAARRNGQLREKDGSFQVFLKGFTGAFLPPLSPFFSTLIRTSVCRRLRLPLQASLSRSSYPLQALSFSCSPPSQETPPPPKLLRPPSLHLRTSESGEGVRRGGRWERV